MGLDMRRPFTTMAMPFARSLLLQLTCSLSLAAGTNASSAPCPRMSGTAAHHHFVALSSFHHSGYASDSANVIAEYSRAVCYAGCRGVIAQRDFQQQFFPDTLNENGGKNAYCKFNDHMLQLFTSSLFLSGAVAAMIGMVTCKRLGRKWTMLMGGVCFLVSHAIKQSCIIYSAFTSLMTTHNLLSTCHTA